MLKRKYTNRTERIVYRTRVGNYRLFDFILESLLPVNVRARG